MALYEFYCDSCSRPFEQITSASDPDQGKCPGCESAEHTRRLISRFAVGGRGDLRESTMHGCHDHFTGHTHGPGCGHSHGGSSGSSSGGSKAD